MMQVKKKESLGTGIKIIEKEKKKVAIEAIHLIVTARPLSTVIVQELCESRGGRPGLFVLTSLMVSVDVKLYRTMLRHWSQLAPNMSTDIRGH